MQNKQEKINKILEKFIKSFHKTHTQTPYAINIIDFEHWCNRENISKNLRKDIVEQLINYFKITTKLIPKQYNCILINYKNQWFCSCGSDHGFPNSITFK